MRRPLISLKNLALVGRTAGETLLELQDQLLHTLEFIAHFQHGLVLFMHVLFKPGHTFLDALI